VASAINAILRALHIQQEIKSEGGIESAPHGLVKMGRYAPSVEACQG